MVKIFLISNAYIEKTLICCLGHLLKINVEEVFLLECNHKKTDVFLDIDINVVLCQNLIIGISSSDIVIVMRDNIISEDNIKRIQKMTKEYKKKFYCLNGELLYGDDVKHSSIPCRELPHIVLASYGSCNANQYYCAEIILNKLFSLKKINFIQSFSKKL